MARKSRAGRKPRGPSRITSEEALDFIRRMQKRFPKPPKTRKERAAVQEYLAQFTDAQLKAVGTRVQSDLMLRPARTIHPDDYEGPRGGYESRRKPRKKR